MGSWSCPNNKCAYDKQLQPRQDCPLCGNAAKEFEFSEFGNLLREKWDYRKSMERTEYPLEIEEGEEIEESQPIMSEKVLGALNVERFGGWRGGLHHRIIVFTENRIIVAETGDKTGTFARWAGGAGGMIYEGQRAEKAGEKLLEVPVEDLLKADKKNFAIDNSEVVSVEFRKRQITIRTTNEAINKKKYKKYPKWLDKWLVYGIPGIKPSKWKGIPVEEIVNVLKQCVAPEKLVIK